MKLLFASFFTLVLVRGVYGANEMTHMAGREDKVPGPPGYASVNDNDRAMERAVVHARRSLGFFLAALRATKPNDRGFEIKKAFVDGSRVEHLWINNLTFDGRKFHGRINNRPLEVHNVSLGQSITLTPSEVTDWMFVKDGKLVGGCTTRVLYARLSAADKERFNKEADFKIE